MYGEWLWLLSDLYLALGLYRYSALSINLANIDIKNICLIFSAKYIHIFIRHFCGFSILFGYLFAIFRFPNIFSNLFIKDLGPTIIVEYSFEWNIQYYQELSISEPYQKRLDCAQPFGNKRTSFVYRVDKVLLWGLKIQIFVWKSGVGK